MDSLNGKNALVTGAGKGIGRAIAIALAIEGVNLAILARTQQDLETLSDELRNLGVKVSILTADVGDMHAVDDAVEKAMQEIGNIDILVNNAGIANLGKFLEIKPADVEGMIRVNLLGVYYTTRAVLPSMIERKTGDIVNISSTAGLRGSATTAAYSASKFGVFGLSESLMQEVRKHNIRVTAMAPSTVVTQLAHESNLITGDEERVMHPEDFAELVIGHLKLNRRVFVKDVSIWSTNP